MSAPSRDDRDGLILSVSVHVLLLFLAALSFASPEDPSEEPPLDLVELELLEFAPAVPVQVGPPQRAEAGSPATPQQSLEPPRPAPPAPSRAQPPPRPRPTPPRPDPIARPDVQRNAPAARPNPPSPARRPEPAPTPRQQVDPTQGTGTSEGESSRSGSNDGPRSGSGGDANAEVSFDLGSRSHTCASIDMSDMPATLVGSTISYRITYAPNGRFVSAQALSRNAGLDRVVRPKLASCRASALPSQATQTNQSVRVTYRARASG